MARRCLTQGAIALLTCFFILQSSNLISQISPSSLTAFPIYDSIRPFSPAWAQPSPPSDNPEEAINPANSEPADRNPADRNPANSNPADNDPALLDNPIFKEKAVEAQIDGFPVTLGGVELFVVQERVGSFSAEDRAQVMSTRIRDIAADPSISLRDFQIEDEAQSTNLVLGNKVIVTITDSDAQAARQARQELAETYHQTIRNAIAQHRQERSKDVLMQGGIYTLVSAIALFIILTILGRLFPWFYRIIDGWQHTWIRPIRIQNLEIISEERTTSLLISLVKLLRIILTLGILYIFVPLILSFFPWTRRLGQIIFSHILAALAQIGQGFVNYLPNICIVLVVGLITFYAIRFIQPIFNEIEQGTLPIPGFYPEWAGPTFNLFRVLIIALALIIAVPYLPGSNSPAFQGVSLFLGVLFSLGSTSAVANVVSGIILIYTRAFQVGDRVKIADALGDVVEKTLLVTRIRTPKNVLITIPNAAVLGGNVINFSASVRESQEPLVLHTTITLGYDVPWRNVYQVLMDAAQATEGILTDPAPFVLQTSLDDFYVSYELNTYTNAPGQIPRIYSRLHENLQDKCNEADIEILSPHYSAVRDGHHITIPAEYLPQDYQPPSFRVHPLSQLIDPKAPR